MEKLVIGYLALIFILGCEQNVLTDCHNDFIPSNDSLYVGGHFNISGNQALSNISLWDGNEWKPLGLGVSGNNPNIECMVFYKGELYVGGIFEIAGWVQVKNIARWNGLHWSDVGTGINGRVTSLVVYNDELYVGGWFSEAGNIQANNIVKWDGDNWSNVGAGFSDEVYTFCIYKNELYAGGWFKKNSSGYFNANSIARWNGVKWDSLMYGVYSDITVNSWVKTISVYNDELFVSGNFTHCGNLSVNNLAKWNGNIWESVSNDTISDRTYSAVVFKDKYHLAGENDSHIINFNQYYAVWNGTSFTFNNFILDGAVYCLYSRDNFLFVGGNFLTVSGQTVDGIFKWDGDKITKLGLGVQGYVSSIISK
jgi:trimeric autotransporter adhesin